MRGKKKIKEEAKRIISALKVKGKELNIIFCSPEYIKGLAKRYLRKDYIPACLAFPFDKVLFGEIYINWESLKSFHIGFLLRHTINNLKKWHRAHK